MASHISRSTLLFADRVSCFTGVLCIFVEGGCTHARTSQCKPTLFCNLYRALTRSDRHVLGRVQRKSMSSFFIKNSSAHSFLVVGGDDALFLTLQMEATWFFARPFCPNTSRLLRLRFIVCALFCTKYFEQIIQQTICCWISKLLILWRTVIIVCGPLSTAANKDTDLN